MCGVVYIQSRGQKDNFEFDINEVTPSLLKDVFELESLPYFLQTKANKKLVEIEKPALVLNEQYLINSPNHEVTKKNRRRRKSKRRPGRRRREAWPFIPPSMFDYSPTNKIYI